MSKIFWIYISGFLLLAYAHLNLGRDLSPYRPVPPLKGSYLERIHSVLEKNLGEKRFVSLLFAYNLGTTQTLDREILDAHKVLGLQHLFTPSGVHLSAFIMGLVPLLKIFGSSAQKIHKGLILLMSVGTFFLPGYYPLKRISLMALLRTTKLKAVFKHATEGLFITTYVLDFFFGTYAFSPLSFCYSYLYTGVVIVGSRYPKVLFPITLLGANILCQFWTQGTYTFLGPILGVVLTLLFGLCFTLIFACFWLCPYLPVTFLLESFCKVYFTLCQLGSELTLVSGVHPISFPLVLFVLILSSGRDFARRKTFLTLLLFLHAPELNAPPLKKLSFPQRNLNLAPREDLVKNWVDEKGVRQLIFLPEEPALFKKIQCGIKGWEEKKNPRCRGQRRKGVKFSILKVPLTSNRHHSPAG